MPHKQLQYFQVHGVFYTFNPPLVAVEMRPVPPGPEELVTGQYRAYEWGIELPKRRPGEKFIVRYTRMFEDVL